MYRIQKYVKKLMKNNIFKREKEKLSKIEEVIEFDHLAPVDDVKDPVTLNLIKQALDNEKVKNIALTGSYGAGKSSILRTFEKENKKGYKYLHISLADFNFEKQREAEGDQLKEFIKKIEKSILQQILYRVDGEELPDSRFKRIKVFKEKKRYFLVPFILLYLLSFTILFKKKYLSGSLIEFLKRKCQDEKFGIAGGESIWINLIAWLIFISLSGYFLNKLLNWISKINISKISLKNMEVEMHEDDENSILNKHLDEILYFFETQDYTVVVIEDLDRLPSIEIFTKLREINTLINKYEKIEKKVTFIYAVKDEIFKYEKERTKFFEMIIPIIPIINSSNSGEKLTKKLVDFNTSKTFIEDISLFIDDMRLLTNISNEFKLYKKQLPLVKDINKLLAMVVYKNLYPKDFSELHLNKGIVYTIINEKKKLIEVRTTKLEKEIDLFKEQIKNIEDETKELKEKTVKDSINSKEELKKLYIATFIELLPERAQLVELNNKRVPLKELRLEENFNLLRSSRNIEYYDNYWMRTAITFKDVEESLNSELSYDERLERVELKEYRNTKTKIRKSYKKIDKLKMEIERLEIEKDELNEKKIGILLKENNTNLFEEYKEKKLIMFLLREGYIDENYHDYISYFYEGSLTFEDQEFLSCLKAGITLDFSHSLSNIDKVVSRLRSGDYGEKGILNYDLISYLGTNFKKLKPEYRKTIKSVSDEDERSIKFIDGYLERFPEDNLFIRELCKKWENIWIYIEKESNFSDDKKNVYLQNILNYADLEDIIEINKDNILKKSIEKLDKFLYLNLKEKELKLVIKELNIKFEKLDIPEEKEGLFNYIYEGNHYIITSKNIEYIIGKLGENTDIKKLNESNYSTIKSLGDNRILSYINENLEHYIENVFLALDENHKESEEVILELIKNEEISFDMRKKIIEKQDTKINTLEEVNEELWDELLKKDKLIASWDNIILKYKKDREITDIIAEFINRKDNFDKLSKITLVDSSDGGEEIEELAKELLKSDKINSETLEKLVKSYSCRYGDFNFEGVDKSRAKDLINLRKLSLSQENIDNLKESFDNLHLDLIKEYKKEYLEAPNEINLNINELIKILDSKEFDLDEKAKLVNSLEEEIFIEDREEELIKIIIKILSEEELNKDIIDRVIASEKINDVNHKKSIYYNQKEFLVEEDRLSLFIKLFEHFSNDEITQILKDLGGNYVDLTQKGLNPSIENTELNAILCEELEKRGCISSFKINGNIIRVYTFKK